MMDERSRNEVFSPKLLDLISNEKEWNMNKSEGKCSEERKLELRLGPPSGEDWCEDKMKNINNTSTERDESLLSLLSYFSNNGFQKQNLSTSDTPAKSILPSSWSSSTSYQHQHQGSNKASSFLVMGNDASQAKLVELQNGAVDKKVFSTPSSANTAVLNNTSQKRNAPGPLVGWPPIRSFRKNIGSSSTSKPQPESSQQQHDKVVGKKHVDKYGNNDGKGLFVKINMDGVPIGRKVDLNAYYSYENLSSSVDQLFRGLLAAQRDSSGSGVKKKEEEKPIIDKMLVGDVPWHMFQSTVKRLRVLKSTELSAFTFGGKKEKIPFDQN
ncbi:putative transcription factor interactor and regulator AUX-IAA family [Lupinus albus]|uniref:Auxin-induced protein n=1 Tax=Lupinus albus TaxID=3870 RepID=A0A6A4MQ41_LUPAL|nr:putative transcription factor interactor and regulator AUX-IAA family [Lupinus albus]